MRFVSAVAALLLCASIASAQTIELINNHDFPIHMPWTVRGLLPSNNGHSSNATIMVDLPPHTQSVMLHPAPLKAAIELAAERDGDGIRLRHRQRDLGKLSWGVVHRRAPAADAKDDAAASAVPQLDFKPLPLKFATRYAVCH